MSKKRGNNVGTENGLRRVWRTADVVRPRANTWEMSYYEVEMIFSRAPHFLSRSEAAIFLGVSIPTMKRWQQKNIGPDVWKDQDGAVFYLEYELLALLAYKDGQRIGLIHDSESILNRTILRSGNSSALRALGVNREQVVIRDA